MKIKLTETQYNTLIKIIDLKMGKFCFKNGHQQKLANGHCMECV